MFNAKTMITKYQKRAIPEAIIGFAGTESKSTILKESSMLEDS